MTRISRIFGEPSCQIYESIGEIRRETPNQNTPPTGRVRYLPKDTSLCIITQVATNTISKRLYCIYGSYQTGTELHRLTAYATTGTELHRLTVSYATTGTELHRLTAYATTGTELHRLTVSYATTGTELHRLTVSYATTGTELHRLTAYATTGTELHRLTAYATIGFFIKILLKNFQSEIV